MSRSDELTALEAPERRRPPGKAIALVTLWGAAVALGFFVLVHYSVTPGASADAPAEWPSGTALPLSSEEPTLVMVVHPRCSCSRASIAELSRLMTRLRGRVDAHVLFVQPPGFERAFTQSDLWTGASIIDGVTVHVDEGGREARTFGAHTSGQVYLYEQGGRLLFSGGITPSRSHQGDSVGRQQIVSLVTSAHATAGRSAVYGCRVEDDARDEAPFSLSSLFRAEGAR